MCSVKHQSGSVSPVTFSNIAIHIPGLLVYAMKITWKTIIFTFITFSLVLIFLELSLIFASFLSSRINQLLLPPSHTVPDDRLGHRPNPELPDHDNKGFRNVSVPKEAKIVALGDSQTYGTGVKSQYAWPRQLELLVDNTVYSMAYGGYGPAHSLILFEEATNLKPDVYIEAFYAGNDLFDSFNLVYNREQLTELKTINKNIERTVRSAEEVEPISLHVSRMFRMGKDKKEESKRRQSMREFLSRHSKLYGLLRCVRRELFNSISYTETKNAWKRAKKFAKANSNYCEIFENGNFKTIFTSEYRLSAIDLQDSRIAEGLRISLEAIKRMSELAVQQDKRFLVILIPTKELVFKNLSQNPSSTYHALIKNEELFWKITKEFLKKHDIEFVDALPSFEASYIGEFSLIRYPMTGIQTNMDIKLLLSLFTQNSSPDNEL